MASIHIVGDSRERRHVSVACSDENEMFSHESPPFALRIVKLSPLISLNRIVVWDTRILQLDRTTTADTGIPSNRMGGLQRTVDCASDEAPASCAPSALSRLNLHVRPVHAVVGLWSSQKTRTQRYPQDQD